MICAECGAQLVQRNDGYWECKKCSKVYDITVTAVNDKHYSRERKETK
jgi:ribosomal protein L37AE/L43A